MSKRIRVNLSLCEGDFELLHHFADRRGMRDSTFAVFLLRKALEDQVALDDYYKSLSDDGVLML